MNNSWRKRRTCSASGKQITAAMCFLFVFFLFSQPAIRPAFGSQNLVRISTAAEISDYLGRYKALTPEQQKRVRDRMDATQLAYLDRLLASSGQGSGGTPSATVTAGSPAILTYTVTARNLSGVPVANPVIRDNGVVLDNSRAVKTGGNTDNTLEVGETWTWTYTRTETGSMGQEIRNTVTIEGPDDQNRDTNPGNNIDGTVVQVVPPPGNYDLSVTKTVSASQQSGPPGMPDEANTQTRPPQVVNECNKWFKANSGGYLGTKDPWDISTIPQGTSFDIKFNAFSVPDRYVVQYPVGNTVYDSGWRGVQSYVTKNPQLYPGGLSGPGAGQKDGVFVKGASNSVMVIVYGPEKGTAWGYEIRANCP